MGRGGVVVIGLSLAVGCGGAGGNEGGAAPGSTSRSSTSAMSATSATGFTSSQASVGSSGNAGGPYSHPRLVAMDFVCKVVSEATIDDPTDNRLHTRFNLRGTDLGVPAIVGSELLLFFGDTVGYREIWDFGEDPDSVARIDLATVAADPAAVCSALDFHVTADDPSVAADTDPTILRDFAAASVTPPVGEDVASYVAQPAGPFPNLPGTFEVPAGALPDGVGGVYLFYAGRVETTPRTRATLGYLAHWASPATTGPSYRIVRAVDSLDARELGGHFVQTAPVRVDDAIYLFGTGDYRRSGVYLARLDSASIETGGESLYDPEAGIFRPAASLDVAARAAIRPLFEDEGVGELSVTYLDHARLFVAVYQRELHDAGGNIVDNRLVLRTAIDPEGPYSEAVTLVDMADPAFRAARCCEPTSCGPDQLLHCDRAGLYGAYSLPIVVAEERGSIFLDLTIPILVSTWDPYNVVLFSAKVELVVAMGR